MYWPIDDMGGIGEPIGAWGICPGWPWLTLFEEFTVEKPEL